MIIIANICGTVTLEFCNGDVLDTFCKWDGEEYYEFGSEGDDLSPDEWMDRYAPETCDGVDEDNCEDGEPMGIDFVDPLEFWSDEDPMPF